MKNLKIQNKLSLVGFIIVGISIIGMSILSVCYNDTKNKYTGFLNGEQLATLMMARAADNINALLYNAHWVTEDATPEQITMSEKWCEDYFGRIPDRLGQVERADPSLQKTVADYRVQYAITHDAVVDVLQAAKAGDRTKAQAALRILDVTGRNLALAMESLGKIRADAARGQSDAIGQSAHHAIVIALASVLGLLASGLAFMVWTARRYIVSPLLDVRDGMLTIADGDLTGTVPHLVRRDEVGAMAAALGKMQAGLRNARSLEAEQERQYREEQAVMQALENALDQTAAGNLVYQIAEPFPERLEPMRQSFNRSMAKLCDSFQLMSAAAQGIQTGSAEISASAEHMSQRTDQQASAIEQSSVALGRVAEMLRASADTAGDAATVTQDAQRGAERSGMTVRNAVASMDRIETCFKEISQVVSLIDDLAFQTNLLALNAGIEAARAGEAGRGFAVVATEVRSLAQRSAEGANQIRDLAATSRKTVGSGVELVRLAGDELASIVNQAGQIHRLVKDIAQSAANQSIAVNEINTAVAEMTQATQQNASLVNQSVEGLRSLAQETTVLGQQIGTFNVNRREKQAFVSVEHHESTRQFAEELELTL